MTRENYNVEDVKDLQARINKMNPVDLAEEFGEISKVETAMRIKLLDKDLLADTFAILDRDKKMEVMESLSDESTRDLIMELDDDELVDTLQELPANLVRKLMVYFIDEDRREAINKLLGYPEESVGSIMSVDFMSVKITDTTGEAIKKVLESDLDAIKMEQIWLTDESLVLVGYIYLADLIRNKGKKLEDFAYGITASVYANDDQEIVAKLAYKYDLGEIPVTDSEGRLIGVVPAEWAIDVMYEEHGEDLSNIHGITDSEIESYADQSTFVIAKHRVTWLIICLITATITGFIIQRYESILATSVILTAYIPMLMDSGGNAGTQSSTTAIRALYAGEIGSKDFFKILFKEVRIGFITGLILVFVNVMRLHFMDGVPLRVNLTVSITLILTIMMSNAIGGILPLIADKLDVDPTVMAGPLITTVVDTCALLIYFEVATLLIGM